MTWAVPDWWHFTLLALAAFRTWRLLAEDTVLAKPRAGLIDRLPSSEYWLTCPWCSGAWIAIAWWLGWTGSGRWATVAAVPFAISALVGLIAANLDPE